MFTESRELLKVSACYAVLQFRQRKAADVFKVDWACLDDPNQGRFKAVAFHAAAWGITFGGGGEKAGCISDFVSGVLL